jgi:hypothetical protein
VRRVNPAVVGEPVSEDPTAMEASRQSRSVRARGWR